MFDKIERLINRSRVLLKLDFDWNYDSKQGLWLTTAHKMTSKLIEAFAQLSIEHKFTITEWTTDKTIKGLGTPEFWFKIKLEPIK